MAPSQKRIVDCASVGDPPKNLRKTTETIRFTVHNFKERKETRGQSIFSPVLKAHGCEWFIEVFPRGAEYSSTDQEFISFNLGIAGECDVVKVFYTSRIKVFEQGGLNIFKSINGDRWGWGNFKLRKTVLDECLDEFGSLVIECDIRNAEDGGRVWYPEKLEPQSTLVGLYEDASSKTSDAVFSVGDATYYAHKDVLSDRCKILYEITEESVDDSTPIPIHSIRKEIFKSILDYIYTVKTPEINEEGVAVELLHAANFYCCVQLKLYVESVIVDKFLKVENAATMLLLADSHSCALLKEAAINLILVTGLNIDKTPDWPKIVESIRLRIQLLEACNSANHSGVDRMNVSSLREELQQANLDVDGSREMLVKRWKTLRSQTRDTCNKV